MPQSDRQKRIADAELASLEADLGARTVEPSAKGDIQVYDGADMRNLAVGSDGEYLKADSTSGVGVSWDTPSGGSTKDYWSGYDTTGGASIDSTATVVFDTELKSSSGSVFSLSAGVLTVNKTGTFMVTYDVTTYEPSASGRGHVEAWLEKNDSEVTGSRSSNYVRTTSQDGTTQSGTVIIDVASGDTLRVRAVDASSAVDVSTEADKSRLTVLEV